MRRLSIFLAIAFAIAIINNAQASCQDIGLEEGQKMDFLRTKWENAGDLLDMGRLSQKDVNFIRRARGMKHMLELVAYNYPDTNLNDDEEFVRTLLKVATGKYEGPNLRSVMINNTIYRQVRTGHGDGDWTESSFYNVLTDKKAGFSAKNGRCQNETFDGRTVGKPCERESYRETFHDFQRYILNSNFNNEKNFCRMMAVAAMQRNGCYSARINEFMDNVVPGEHVRYQSRSTKFCQINVRSGKYQVLIDSMASPPVADVRYSIWD